MRKRKGMSVVTGSVLLAGCLMVGSSWAADTATRGGKNSAEAGREKKPGLAANAGAVVIDAAQEKTPGRKHTKSSLAAAPAKAEEIARLKEQLAQQQKQIEQLRAALDEQRQMLERALEPSRTPSAEEPNLGQVASLAPVIPAAPPAKAVSAGLAYPSSSAQPVGAGGVLAPAAAGGAPPVTQDEMKSYTQKVDQLDKAVGALSKGLGNFNISGDVRVRAETFNQSGAQARYRQRIRARLNLKGNISDDMFGGISFGSGDTNDPISTNQTETAFYTRKPFYLNLAYLTINPKAFRALSITGGKQEYPWYRTELTWDNDLNPEGFSEKLSFNSKSFLKNFTVVGFQLPFNEVSSGPDSFTYGGQLQLKFNAGEKGTFELYGGGMKFSHPDAIAVAQGNKSLANSLTNTVVRDANNNVIGYAGQFLYVTASVKAGYKVAPKWPFDVGFDFVQNTQAATDQRRGYMAEASIGQEKNPKDVKFGYKYYHIQKDAVISAFNFSDLRTATDVQNHVFFVGYQIIKNVSGEWTYLLGKRLNDPADKWLSRMQFDLVYKF